MSWLFKIALAIDGIGILVGLYFIFSDLLKSSSSNNGLLSMVTLVFCGWVGASYYLYHHGQKGIASAMAWIPAIPLLLYGLFVLMFIIFKPDMK